ncbi:glycosyltransferase family 4 protein [Cytobacillus depressus]|uniref:Glycosyltransferase family 4 protein n=1 Tax=Cytobacillus depressus TaxID=1602942 RepID=A0A6L3V882_9BACI|nr:glycosyltransferase family 4 protein [Cytobacillus depressus]KAB2336565.1 glycosyltransferase family 4 protein [Cytobacillus depressus]
MNKIIIESKKKVLLVASVYSHFTAFHVPYIKFLQSIGYEVWIASNHSKRVNTAKTELEEEGAKCIDIDLPRSPFTIKTIEGLSQIIKLLKSHDFSMIHVHTPNAAFITRLANFFSEKIPLIYTAHGFHFYKGAPLINWLIYFPLEYIAKYWTDRVITINYEDYYRALKMGYNEGSVKYVHGVGVEEDNLILNEDDKKNFKHTLGLNNDSVVISYIAEINNNKNHRFLIRNWTKIKEQIPEAVLLLIGDGNLRSEIENMIIRDDLRDIYLLGYRKDVNKILRISDIVSLLSRREGLPKSIMEAMENKLPCVVTDTRGLRDLITHNSNGYVIELEDDNGLINAFVDLLKDQSLRKKMGNSAFKRVQPYLIKNVLNEYIEIYNEILID